MRIVEAHLMDHKMDEAVTHYINSHQTGEVTLKKNNIKLYYLFNHFGRLARSNSLSLTNQTR